MYTTQECRGRSKTWGAYITKFDTIVQQVMMSRKGGGGEKLTKI